MTSFKVNADQSAAVSTDSYWNYDMSKCPRGPKVQLLVKDGNAVYGHYSGQDYFEAWGPMLKRKPKTDVPMDEVYRNVHAVYLNSFSLDALGLTEQDRQDLYHHGRLTVGESAYLTPGDPA